MSRAVARTDPSTINRTHSCTLIPVTSAAALCRMFGRSAESVAILQALAQPIPETWQLLDQQEANAAAGEVDLLLDEEIDDGAGFEAEDQSFAHELTGMQAFEPIADDESRIAQYALKPIPPVLSRELQTYLEYRTSVFQAKRASGAILSVSAEQDKRQLLRFYGWMRHADREPDGTSLHLALPNSSVRSISSPRRSDASVRALLRTFVLPMPA